MICKTCGHEDIDHITGDDECYCLGLIFNFNIDDKCICPIFEPEEKIDKAEG